MLLQLSVGGPAKQIPRSRSSKQIQEILVAAKASDRYSNSVLDGEAVVCFLAN